LELANFMESIRAGSIPQLGGIVGNTAFG
jgi:hypothetical protein